MELERSIGTHKIVCQYFFQVPCMHVFMFGQVSL